MQWFNIDRTMHHFSLAMIAIQLVCLHETTPPKQAQSFFCWVLPCDDVTRAKRRQNWLAKADWSWLLGMSYLHNFPSTYCWWKKSCTTKDDDYPIIFRVLAIPGGAGFCPSTVSGQNIATSHDLGSRMVAFWKGNLLFSGKSRLVKKYYN